VIGHGTIHRRLAGSNTQSWNALEGKIAFKPHAKAGEETRGISCENQCCEKVRVPVPQVPVTLKEIKRNKPPRGPGGEGPAKRAGWGRDNVRGCQSHIKLQR